MIQRWDSKWEVDRKNRQTTTCCEREKWSFRWLIGWGQVCSIMTENKKETCTRTRDVTSPVCFRYCHIACEWKTQLFLKLFNSQYSRQYMFFTLEDWNHLGQWNPTGPYIWKMQVLAQVVDVTTEALEESIRAKPCAHWQQLNCWSLLSVCTCRHSFSTPLSGNRSPFPIHWRLLLNMNPGLLSCPTNSYQKLPTLIKTKDLHWTLRVWMLTPFATGLAIGLRTLLNLCCMWLNFLAIKKGYETF